VASKTKKSTKPDELENPLGLGHLSELVNVKEEDDDRVVQFAESEGVALIAFIASYVPVRVSPIEEVRAAISLPDEFGIEALVELLREAGTQDAYLLVNSLGGANEFVLQDCQGYSLHPRQHRYLRTTYRCKAAAPCLH